MKTLPQQRGNVPSGYILHPKIHDSYRGDHVIKTQPRTIYPRNRQPFVQWNDTGLCRLATLEDDKVNAQGYEGLVGQLSGGVGR